MNNIGIVKYFLIKTNRFIIYIYINILNLFLDLIKDS